MEGGSGAEIGGSGSNYLACIVEKELVPDKEGRFCVRIALVAVNVSTGDVVHGEFDDNSLRTGLEAVLISLSPSEMLLGEPFSSVTEKVVLLDNGK